jgi:hypothetical protein
VEVGCMEWIDFSKNLKRRKIIVNNFDLIKTPDD